MALKLKITKSAFESLSDELKSEYKLKGDEYVLDVTGIEDTGPLLRAKEHEVARRKEAEAKVRELETTVASLESGSDSRVTQLQSELENTKTATAKQIGELRSVIETNLLNSTATSIASTISTSPKLLLPHIKSRLSVGFDDNNVPTVTILDGAGKPSKLTVEELSNEFVANKEFSAIIKGSGSSGGAGQKTQTGGAKPSQFINQSGAQTVDPSRLNPRDLAAWTAERRAARGEQTGEQNNAE